MNIFTKALRNNYLPAFIISVLLSASASAQVDTNKVRQQINAYGYSYKNISIDSSLRVPRDTFTLRYSDTSSIAIVNDVLYVWNGLQWNPVARKLTDSTIQVGSDTVLVGGTGSGGSTNLGYTASPTDGTITSTTGTSATVPLANGTNAGLLSPDGYGVINDSAVTVVSKTDSITSYYNHQGELVHKDTAYSYYKGFGLNKSGYVFSADTTRSTGIPSYYYTDSISAARGGGGSADSSTFSTNYRRDTLGVNLRSEIDRVNDAANPYLPYQFSNPHQSGRLFKWLKGVLEFDLIYNKEVGMYQIVYTPNEGNVTFRQAPTIQGLDTATATSITLPAGVGVWPTIQYANGKYILAVMTRPAGLNNVYIYSSIYPTSGYTLKQTISGDADASIRYDSLSNKWVLVTNTKNDIYGLNTYPVRVYTSDYADSNYVYQHDIFRPNQRNDWHNTFEADPMFFTYGGRRYLIFGNQGSYYARGCSIVELDSLYNPIGQSYMIIGALERWENANTGNPVFLYDKDGTLKIFYNEFYWGTSSDASYYGLQYIQARNFYDRGNIYSDSLLFDLKNYSINSTLKSQGYKTYGNVIVGNDYVQFYSNKSGINQLIKKDTISSGTIIVDIRVDSLTSSNQRIITANSGENGISGGTFGLYINSENRFSLVSNDPGTGYLTSFGPILKNGNRYQVIIRHDDSVTDAYINGHKFYEFVDKWDGLNSKRISFIKIANDSNAISFNSSGSQCYCTLYDVKFYSDQIRRDVFSNADTMQIPKTWDTDFLNYLRKIKESGGSLSIDEMTGINNFIVDLKSAGIFSNTYFKGIWLGNGLDTSLSINLLDISSRTVFNTGASNKSSLGIQWSSGTTSYGDTKISSGSLSGSNIHLSYYTPKDLTSTGMALGAFDGTNAIFMYIGGYYRIGDASHNITNTTKSAGFYILNRTAANRTLLFKDGVKLDSNTTTATTALPSSLNVFVGANSTNTPNAGSNYISGNAGLWSIGTGLSDAQALAYSNAVNKLANTLGWVKNTDIQKSRRVVAGSNITISSSIFADTISATGGGSLTLDTTGNSGGATYSGGTLNVPVYLSAGDRSFFDSTKNGLIYDSIEVSLVNSQDVYLKRKAYGSSAWDSAFQFTIPNVSAWDSVIRTTLTTTSTSGDFSNATLSRIVNVPNGSAGTYRIEATCNDGSGHFFTSIKMGHYYKSSGGTLTVGTASAMVTDVNSGLPTETALTIVNSGDNLAFTVTTGTVTAVSTGYWKINICLTSNEGPAF